MRDSADAVRLAAELECCRQTVKLYEDGDLQEDGSILWSGCATGDCAVCGQLYADWWEGTFKIGGPTKMAERAVGDGLSDDSPSTDTEAIGPARQVHLT